MTKISKMDRTTANRLGEELEAAAQVIAAKYGLQAKRKSGKFDDGSFTGKIEFAIIGEGGLAETREVGDFKRYAEMYGLAADDLGREFTANGRRYKICGLAMSSRRLPILASTADGKIYKFTADGVKKVLEKEKAAA
jgi:hypothetical protein